MKPDFVIIGAQKSGSTTLMRHLGDHPQVFMPQGETRYFRDPWFQMESPEVLDRDVASTKPGVRRRGIKCPDLLALQAGPRRLHDVLGQVELIAVLREPVERAVSAYFWGMQWGWVPLAPPEIGLRRLLAGEYAADHPRAAEVLEYGRYAEHLARYREVFPAEKLLVILDQDMRDDIGATARRSFEFLGVDTSVPLSEPARRVNEGVYSPLRLRVLQHRHRYILREYPGYPGKYSQPARGLKARVVNRGIAALDRVVLARVCDNSKPSISPGLRADLFAYYRDDVAALASLLGRDLSGWTARYQPTPRSLH